MIFSRASFLLLFVLLSPVPASSAPRALKPVTKRFQRRDSRRSIVPAHEAVISYGEDHSASSALYHADLVLRAHHSKPILLLEEIEALTSAISCDATGISIRFRSATDALLAANTWTPEMVAVTNHPLQGCGPADDRTPYLVKQIDSRNPPTLHLSAIRIPWRTAAKKFGVSLTHSSPETFSRELRRRQEVRTNKDGSEGDATLSLKTNIPSRVQLYPPPVSNTTESSPGPEESGKNSNSASGKNGSNDAGKDGKVVAGVNPDFRVNCVGCTTAGQILVKAVFDVDTNLPDFGDGGESGGKFFDLVVLDTAMLEVEIADDLKARANIEMFAGASSTISFTQRILPLPVTISPFQIGALLSIGPIFDFEVAMDITGPSASVNFTYGAELVVPKGAKATLDYGKSNKTGASGWDKSEINEIPFNLNSLDGELSFAVNLTARPKFTFGVLVGAATVASLDAGFELDLPKVYAKATALRNVSTTCEPPAEDEYTFHPTAIKIESGLGFALRAVAEFEAGGRGALPSLINHQFDYALFEKDFPAKDICLGFDTQSLGEMKNITEFKEELDVAKVQAVVDNTGELPARVDVKSFEAAGGKMKNDTKSGVEGNQSKQPAAEKGVATTVRVGRLCAMLIAVGVGFVLL